MNPDAWNISGEARSETGKRFLPLLRAARVLAALALFAALITQNAAEAMPVKVETDAPAATSDRREMLVSEPVFNGAAYITEAGRGHSSSVVLVHGVGDGGARDWEQLIPVLAEQYHVVAFDLPGFGRSSKSNSLYSPERYARFIKWATREYVKAPFVLIGHSLGGAIALRYAADHPGDLRRLILVDAAGILYRASLIKEMYQEKAEGNGNGPPSRRAESFNTFIRFMLDNVSNDQRAKKLKKALESESTRSVMLGGDPKKIAAMALMLEDFSTDVERVRTPTLLIWGEKDTTAPLRTARALMGRLPGARLEIIAKAGHVPMREQTAEFNRIIMDELAGGGREAPAVTALKHIPQEDGDRVGSCDGQQGMLFMGRYKRIELNRCRDVTIANVIAERIDVVSSDVVMENSTIRGKDVAIQARRADIVGTNVSIEADTAIHASHSHIDFAGAKLKAKKSVAESDNRSILIFSISRSDSPSYSGPLHGARTVTRRKPL